MRKQHCLIRQQLICCFIHTYTRAHHFPPIVREIGEWMGYPGMRSLQLAPADLERQKYLMRQSHAQRSMVLTAKGIALAERWRLLVPVAGAVVETPQAKPLHDNPPITLQNTASPVVYCLAAGRPREVARQISRNYQTSYEAAR